METRKSFLRFCYELLILSVTLGLPQVYGQTVVSGTITYEEEGQRKALRGASVRIEVYSADNTTTWASGISPDDIGYFAVTLPDWLTPGQVTARLSFLNSKIDLRGVFTTRSTFNSVVAVGKIGPAEHCPEGIPCDFDLSTKFDHMDFTFISGSDRNNYSIIFTYANAAADFAIAHGYTPPQCVIKYPSEQSIIQEWSLPSGSFYWPFSTISDRDVIFNVVGILYEIHTPATNTLADILTAINNICPDCHGELTNRAVYLNGFVANSHSRTTIFHEYGHFLMDAKRGWNWPYGFEEFITRRFHPEHKWSETHQVDRVAFVEGWADFYGSAVESWLTNPLAPYSGRYQEAQDDQPVGKDYPSIMENVEGADLELPDRSGLLYPSIPNGYNHELIVGAAFFDFYDPSSLSEADNFQTSFTNILDVIGERYSVMPEFIANFAHKSFLIDQQRNAGINIMNINKMDPLTSYGTATMTIKNDFNAGIVNIDNVDVNTSSIGGSVSQTQLWMSSKRLQAKEQLYDNYQRVFKGTHPILATDTWTTTNPIKFNFADVWSTYTDALTATANFDQLCNITVNYVSLDGVTIPGSSTNTYRSRMPLALSAPDYGTQKFLRWDDGSTDNPRSIIVSEHHTYTAYYKAHLASTTSSALSSNAQRKLVRDASGKLSLLYESATAIWNTTSTDNGATWSNESVVGNLPTATSFYRNATLALEADGSSVSKVYEGLLDAGAGTWQHDIYYNGTSVGLFIADQSFEAMPVFVTTRSIAPPPTPPGATGVPWILAGVWRDP
ncbi:MAG: hypothetical protein HYR76_06730, partial [Ignavibacteria bacterium]|nr:hypothetical protein [Ignavibacteria bacterium]